MVLPALFCYIFQLSIQLISKIFFPVPSISSDISQSILLLHSYLHHVKFYFLFFVCVEYVIFLSAFLWNLTGFLTASPLLCALLLTRLITMVTRVKKFRQREINQKIQRRMYTYLQHFYHQELYLCYVV